MNNLSTAGKVVCSYTYRDCDSCTCEKCLNYKYFLLEARIAVIEKTNMQTDL